MHELTIYKVETTDRQKAKRLVLVDDLFAVVWNYDQALRTKIKNTDSEDTIHDREVLRQMLEEASINMEELYN